MRPSFLNVEVARLGPFLYTASRLCLPGGPSILIFNDSEMMDKLERLPNELRAAFACACAERLYPAYAAYTNRTGRGDASVLRKTLTRLWSDLSGDTMSDEDVQKGIRECKALTPREEDGPWIPERDYADDAVSAAVFAFMCRENGGAREAVWAAGRAYESLDAYLIERDDPDLNTPAGEDHVLADPLLQAELGRQRRDLDELLEVPPGDRPQAVRRLCSRASEESRVFFGPPAK